MLFLNTKKNKAELNLNTILKNSEDTKKNIVSFLIPKNHSAKKVGLLNHMSLLSNEGLLYKNTYLFHTFGMFFPIGIICFDKSYKILSKPIVIQKNCLFIVPFKTKYVAEINHEIIDKINESHYSEKVLVYKNKLFLYIFKYLKQILILNLFIFSLFIFMAAYAEESLKLSLGRDKTIDLGNAPQSIQNSDPDILDIQRVGLTNSIKLIPKQNGKVKLIIQYTGGIENIWNIQIGKEDNSYSSNLGDIYTENQNLSLQAVARTLNQISGIKYQIKNGKIILLGHITDYESFRKLVVAVVSKPNVFFPAYSLSKEIENAVFKSIQSDLKLFGERDLRILNKSGLYSLSGVPSSPIGKNKSWQFLSALIPNLIDSTSNMTGDSAIIQVNLEFLEVGKSEKIEAGFQQPGMNQSISGTLSFAPNLLSSGISQPTLQIAPLTSLLKALQERSYARNLAKPVVITRSGEKASFLAGGEVPIVSSSFNTNGQSSSVSYKPFGILFHVTPNLQTDGSIWLKLDLEVSDISEQLSYQNVPGFTTRRVNTNIILKDKKYAILSGLVQTKNSKNVERFPILGSIPIIGELFKSRRFKDDESELWVAVSAMRGDLLDEDKDVQVLIENKFASYKKNITGSLLD